MEYVLMPFSLETLFRLLLERIMPRPVPLKQRFGEVITNLPSNVDSRPGRRFYSR